MLKNAFNYISSYHLILIFFFFFFWIFLLFFFGRSDNRALFHLIFQKYLFIYLSLSLSLGFVPPPGRILKWFPNCFPVKYGFLFIFYILLGRFDIYISIIYSHTLHHTHTHKTFTYLHYTLHTTHLVHRQTTGKGGDQLNLYTTLTYIFKEKWELTTPFPHCPFIKFSFERLSSLSLSLHLTFFYTFFYLIIWICIKRFDDAEEIIP